MKRLLLIGALIFVAFLAGRALYVSMASDETRIGWLFADEAAAFNSASAFSTLDHFALDYHDDTDGWDLPTLRGAVIWAFQNRRDAQHRFLLRVELPEQAGTVAVDGDTATAEFPVRLHEGRGSDERLGWELRVTAGLRRIDGEWRVVRSTHETVSGQRPGR